MDPRLQWTRPKLSQPWQPNTVFQHVHWHKEEHLPTDGARNYRRQHPVPEEHKQPLSCRPHLTILVLLVFFIMTTIAAVTVLIIREISRKDSNPNVQGNVLVNPEALMSAYPGMFRTMDQQTDVIGIKPKFKDFKPVKRFIDVPTTCSVSCDSPNQGVPKPMSPVTMHPNAVRAKMMASNVTGVSRMPRIRNKRNFYHISPTTQRNIEGQARTLVQLKNTRQFFQIENCSQAVGCDGCRCMTNQVLTTAVVLKTDLDMTAGTTMDDIEIQTFYFDGCCKCVNVGLKN
ncbi:uncharacterized protein LOC110448972 isoform X2 [Mizuhopecten yessoensis]|uniref:uncharacterized protein LOC110448972 isoform X2 n=1 Tax=Mizuhopecten yessoensis TaxID=6573 RepID=UPI000B457326|nr:uncharacterized protein LOC110448972 isoform X2 [Mizuhopecten yessoensis]